MLRTLTVALAALFSIIAFAALAKPGGGPGGHPGGPGPSMVHHMMEHEHHGDQDHRDRHDHDHDHYKKKKGHGGDDVEVDTGNDDDDEDDDSTTAAHCYKQIHQHGKLIKVRTACKNSK